jgi:hypothetical protein
VQSPFLLGATLKRHLESLKERYPNEVAEIEKCLYVDDVITGGDTKEEVLDLKETTVAIFEEAKFELHKWHSNELVLEAKSEPDECDDEKQSYAKDQLGVKAGETKLLGLPWNKNNDTISVTFPQPIAETTKREMLRFLVSIYDPLGLVSPTTLSGKLMHQQVEWWIKRVQDSSSGTDEFQGDKLRLNLQLNSAGLYECRGRIRGEFPLYLPPAAR